MNTIKVTYRDIAKMLCQAMPIEGQSHTDKVNGYIETITGMSQEAKTALKAAYIFSRKVPREEREDMFQDLTLAILKTQTKDERLAYTIARCDWRNWWAKYRIRQHMSLDSVVEDEDGSQTSLGELLVGECEFENKINGELEAQRIWDLLPPAIKTLVGKRLSGYSLRKLERECLERWAAKNAMTLVS